ncbi:MAG: hypothetical protein AAF763_19770 [Pseudomonadota bacterium]
MLTTLITIVKIAGVSGVLILAWAALKARKPDAAPALETADIARHDATGALVFKGFHVMLIIGAVSMLLLTLSDVFAVL